MNIDDVICIYDEYKAKYGRDAYKHISLLLKEIREEHKKDYMNSERARKRQEDGKTPDPEQSWKSFKGNCLEKLLNYILKDYVNELGWRIIDGKVLQKSNGSEEVKKVKRNIMVDYGRVFHLPDADLVIYNPTSFEVIAIISSKTSLRERIAQTGYWKLKLSNDIVTKHIKVLFITLDEDSTLSCMEKPTKGRSIAEADTHGTYVLTANHLEESDTVKLFDKFIDDLGKWKKSK